MNQLLIWLSQRSGILLFGLITWVLLLLSDVSVKDSSLLVTLIAGQVIAGISLTRRITQRFDCSPFALLALGFAFGQILVVVLHLLLIWFNFQNHASLIVTPILLSTLLGNSARKGLTHLHFSVSEGLAVAGLAFLALGIAHVWQLPFALLLLLASFYLSPMVQMKVFSKRKGLTVSVVAVFLLNLFLAVFFVYERATSWWFKISDISFTEAAAASFVRFGLSEHVSTAGMGSITSHHWLSYAWTGVVQAAVNAEPWIISTRASQVVIALFILVALWALLRESMGVGFLSSLLVGLVCAVSAFRFGANFSMIFGHLWLFLLAIVAVVGASRWNDFRHRFLLFVLFTSLLLSKGQTGLQFAIAFCLLGVARQSVGRSRVQELLIRVSLLFPSFLLVWILQEAFRGGSAVGSQIGFDLVSVGSFGEIGNLRNLAAVPLALVVLGATASVLIGAIFYSRSQVSAVSEVVSFFAVFGLCGLGIMIVTNAANQTLALYLAQNANLAVLFTGSLIVVTTFGKSANRWRLILVVLILCFWVYFAEPVWRQLFESDPNGSFGQVLRRSLAGATWPVSLSAVVIGLVFVVRRLAPRSGLGTLFLGVFLVVLTNPIQWSLDQATDVRTWLNSHGVVRSEVFAFMPEVEKLRTTIRLLSEESDVVATNAFCFRDVESCAELDWFSRINASIVSQHQDDKCVDFQSWAVDQSLAPTFNRSFWVLGPVDYTFCRPFPAWLIERVELSESFARRPTMAICQKMVSQGVRFFLVDKMTSTANSWAPFAEIVEETGRFTLLSIQTQECSS